MIKTSAGILIKINQRLLAFEKSLLCFLLSVTIFLAFGQIVMRNLFDTGFIWVDPVLKICVLWIAFVGASLAMESKGHIKIDLLYNIIRSGPARTTIEMIAQISTTIICGLLLAASLGYLAAISSDPRASVIPGIPDWSFRCIIPYGFLVMAIRSMIHTLNLAVDSK